MPVRGALPDTVPGGLFAPDSIKDALEFVHQFLVLGEETFEAFKIFLLGFFQGHWNQFFLEIWQIRDFDALGFDAHQVAHFNGGCKVVRSGDLFWHMWQVVRVTDGIADICPDTHGFFQHTENRGCPDICLGSIAEQSIE